MLNLKYTEIGIFAGIALILGMFCTFSFLAPRTSLMNMDSTRVGMQLGYFTCTSNTGEYTMCDSKKGNQFGVKGQTVNNDMSYGAYEKGKSGVQPMYLFTVCMLAFVLLSAFNGSLKSAKRSLYVLGGCSIIGIIGVIGAKFIFGIIFSILICFILFLLIPDSIFLDKKNKR